MKIDIWSDIACPFCYLGKQQFTSALEAFAHKDKVEVTYHSFELDPEATRDYDGTMYDMLMRKKDMPRAQVEQMIGSIVERAAEVGLAYNMKDVVITNTHDAHRLIHFARTQGKQSEMIDSLYAAYYTDGKHLGDHETLANLAANIGIDRAATLTALTGNDFEADVKRDVDQAAALGITGVPFTVINQTYGISGAQGQAVFTEALQAAWHEAHPLQIIGNENAAVCVDGTC